MINKRHILPSFHNWKYGFLGVQINYLTGGKLYEEK